MTLICHLGFVIWIFLFVQSQYVSYLFHCPLQYVIHHPIFVLFGKLDLLPGYGQAALEVKLADQYKYRVVNDVLERAVEEIRGILELDSSKK